MGLARGGSLLLLALSGAALALHGVLGLSAASVFESSLEGVPVPSSIQAGDPGLLALSESLHRSSLVLAASGAALAVAGGLLLAAHRGLRGVEGLGAAAGLSALVGGVGLALSLPMIAGVVGRVLYAGYRGGPGAARVVLEAEGALLGLWSITSLAALAAALLSYLLYSLLLLRLARTGGEGLLALPALLLAGGAASLLAWEALGREALGYLPLYASYLLITLSGAVLAGLLALRRGAAARLAPP